MQAKTKLSRPEQFVHDMAAFMREYGREVEIKEERSPSIPGHEDFVHLTAIGRGRLYSQITIIVSAHYSPFTRRWLFSGATVYPRTLKAQKRDTYRSARILVEVWS